MYSSIQHLETIHHSRSLIILLLVSIEEAEHFLHSRETSFVAEGAAIANTFNVADRLRSRNRKVSTPAWKAMMQLLRCQRTWSVA